MAVRFCLVAAAAMLQLVAARPSGGTRSQLIATLAERAEACLSAAWLSLESFFSLLGSALANALPTLWWALSSDFVWWTLVAAPFLTIAAYLFARTLVALLVKLLGRCFPSLQQLSISPQQAKLVVDKVVLVLIVATFDAVLVRASVDVALADSTAECPAWGEETDADLLLMLWDLATGMVGLAAALLAGALAWILAQSANLPARLHALRGGSVTQVGVWKPLAIVAGPGASFAAAAVALSLTALSFHDVLLSLPGLVSTLVFVCLLVTSLITDARLAAGLPAPAQTFTPAGLVLSCVLCGARRSAPAFLDFVAGVLTSLVACMRKAASLEDGSAEALQSMRATLDCSLRDCFVEPAALRTPAARRKEEGQGEGGGLADAPAGIELPLDTTISAVQRAAAGFRVGAGGTGQEIFGRLLHPIVQDEHGGPVSAWFDQVEASLARELGPQKCDSCGSAGSRIRGAVQALLSDSKLKSALLSSLALTLSRVDIPLREQMLDASGETPSWTSAIVSVGTSHHILTALGVGVLSWTFDKLMAALWKCATPRHSAPRAAEDEAAWHRIVWLIIPNASVAAAAAVLPVCLATVLAIDHAPAAAASLSGVPDFVGALADAALLFLGCCWLFGLVAAIRLFAANAKSWSQVREILSHVRASAFHLVKGNFNPDSQVHLEGLNRQIKGLAAWLRARASGEDSGNAEAAAERRVGIPGGGGRHSQTASMLPRFLSPAKAKEMLANLCKLIPGDMLYVVGLSTAIANPASAELLASFQGASVALKCLAPPPPSAKDRHSPGGDKSRPPANASGTGTASDPAKASASPTASKSGAASARPESMEWRNALVLQTISPTAQPLDGPFVVRTRESVAPLLKSARDARHPDDAGGAGLDARGDAAGEPRHAAAAAQMAFAVFADGSMVERPLSALLAQCVDKIYGTVRAKFPFLPELPASSGSVQLPEMAAHVSLRLSVATQLIGKLDDTRVWSTSAREVHAEGPSTSNLKGRENVELVVDNLAHILLNVASQAFPSDDVSMVDAVRQEYAKEWASAVEEAGLRLKPGLPLVDEACLNDTNRMAAALAMAMCPPTASACRRDLFIDMTLSTIWDDPNMARHYRSGPALMFHAVSRLDSSLAERWDIWSGSDFAAKLADSIEHVESLFQATEKVQDQLANGGTVGPVGANLAEEGLERRAGRIGFSQWLYTSREAAKTLLSGRYGEDLRTWCLCDALTDDENTDALAKFSLINRRLRGAIARALLRLAKGLLGRVLHHSLTNVKAILEKKPKWVSLCIDWLEEAAQAVAATAAAARVAASAGTQTDAAKAGGPGLAAVARPKPEDEPNVALPAINLEGLVDALSPIVGGQLHNIASAAIILGLVHNRNDEESPCIADYGRDEVQQPQQADPFVLALDQFLEEMCLSSEYWTETRGHPAVTIEPQSPAAAKEGVHQPEDDLSERRVRHELEDGEPEEDRPRGDGEPAQDRPRGDGEPEKDRPRGDGEAEEDRPRGDGEAAKDRPRGDGEAEKDQPRGDGEAEKDQPRGDGEAEKGRPRGDGEAEKDQPRGDGEAEKDQPRGDGEAEKDQPRGDGEPEKDQPRGDGEPEKDRPRGGGEPEKDQPRGDGEPEKDRPRGDGEAEKDQPRGDGEPEKDRPRGDGEPEKDRPRGDGEPEKDQPRGDGEPEKDRPRGDGEPEKDRPRGDGEPEKDRPTSIGLDHNPLREGPGCVPLSLGRQDDSVAPEGVEVADSFDNRLKRHAAGTAASKVVPRVLALPQMLSLAASEPAAALKLVLGEGEVPRRGDALASCLGQPSGGRVSATVEVLLRTAKEVEALSSSLVGSPSGAAGDALADAMARSPVGAPLRAVLAAVTKEGAAASWTQTKQKRHAAPASAQREAKGSMDIFLQPDQLIEEEESPPAPDDPVSGMDDDAHAAGRACASWDRLASWLGKARMASGSWGGRLRAASEGELPSQDVLGACAAQAIATHLMRICSELTPLIDQAVELQAPWPVPQPGHHEASGLMSAWAVDCEKPAVERPATSPRVTADTQLAMRASYVFPMMRFIAGRGDAFGASILRSVAGQDTGPRASAGGSDAIAAKIVPHVKAVLKAVRSSKQLELAAAWLKREAASTPLVLSKAEGVPSKLFAGVVVAGVWNATHLTKSEAFKLKRTTTAALFGGSFDVANAIIASKPSDASELGVSASATPVGPDDAALAEKALATVQDSRSNRLAESFVALGLLVSAVSLDGDEDRVRQLETRSAASSPVEWA
ncbi:hypothetical protein FNF29_00483 [Cafeteria roenbergensis]|uniref:Uncharacterized protein n=1 Tax=Cafeteria roenbergensis TaxID=33653 RepID=A0A5A8CZB6_CAFRO|nr:hypothetical protein FNF29_00483 [Cafeteria roenbergensis]|eukprot:KAA0157131.1 hypothetical protein FNF29_00483 [Cafeteria roenbergensis]